MFVASLIITTIVSVCERGWTVCHTLLSYQILNYTVLSWTQNQVSGEAGFHMQEIFIGHLDLKLFFSGPSHTNRQIARTQTRTHTHSHKLTASSTC